MSGPGRSVGGGGLLVVGDVVTDVVVRTPPHRCTARTRPPDPTLPGGAGANAACWAVRSGCRDVRLLARAGTRIRGLARDALRRAGVRPLLCVDADAADRHGGGAGRLLGRAHLPHRQRGGPATLARRLVSFAAGRCRPAPSVRISPLRADEPGDGGTGAAGSPAAGCPGERGSGFGRIPRRTGRRHVPGPGRGGRSAAAQRGRGTRADGAAGSLGRRGQAEPSCGPGRRHSRGPGRAAGGRRHGDRACARRGGRRAGGLDGAGDAFTGGFLAALIAGADEVSAAAAGCRAGAEAVATVGGRPA